MDAELQNGLAAQADSVSCRVQVLFPGCKVKYLPSVPCTVHAGAALVGRQVLGATSRSGLQVQVRVLVKAAGAGRRRQAQARAGAVCRVPPLVP